jgi:hypothetical protein
VQSLRLLPCFFKDITSQPAFDTRRIASNPSKCVELCRTDDLWTAPFFETVARCNTRFFHGGGRRDGVNLPSPTIAGAGDGL